MSWPQNWPQQTMPVSNIMPQMIPEAVNQYNQMQYQTLSHEQQFAMQQNWQQWQTYHQQYAEWHAKFGEQYQREVETKASLQPPLPTMELLPVQPPLPNIPSITAIPPPLPPEPSTDDRKKPIPSLLDEPISKYMCDEQKNDTYNRRNDNNNDNNDKKRWNSGGGQPNQRWNQQNQNRSGGRYQNKRNEGHKFNDTKSSVSFNDNHGAIKSDDNNFNRNNYNENNRNNFNKTFVESKRQTEPIIPNNRVSDFTSREGNYNNSTQNNVPEDSTSDEKAFDDQFRTWEEEFTRWKEQNANHPDKKAYREYEMKFEECRQKLLERREQMRRRKIEENEKTKKFTFNEKPNDRFQKTRFDEDAFQDDTLPINFESFENNKVEKPADRFERSQINSNRLIEQLNSDDNIFKPTIAGIPGLDLVPAELKKTPVKIVEEVADVIDLECDQIKQLNSIDTNVMENKPITDLNAISKNINTLLGDPKLLTLLQLVTNEANIQSINSQTTLNPLLSVLGQLAQPNTNNDLQQQLLLKQQLETNQLQQQSQNQIQSQRQTLNFNPMCFGNPPVNNTNNNNTNNNISNVNNIINNSNINNNNNSVINFEQQIRKNKNEGSISNRSNCSARSEDQDTNRNVNSLQSLDRGYSNERDSYEKNDRNQYNIRNDNRNDDYDQSRYQNRDEQDRNFDLRNTNNFQSNDLNRFSDQRFDRMSNLDNNSRYDRLDNFDNNSRYDRLDSMDNTSRYDRMDNLDNNSRYDRFDNVNNVSRSDRIDNMDNNSRYGRMDNMDNDSRYDHMENLNMDRIQRYDQIDSYDIDLNRGGGGGGSGSNSMMLNNRNRYDYPTNDEIFKPAKVIDYQNKSQNISARRYLDDEDILMPVKVVDYGHKKLAVPLETDSDYLKPVTTIDYGHSSVKRKRNDGNTVKYDYNINKRRDQYIDQYSDNYSDHYSDKNYSDIDRERSTNNDWLDKERNDKENSNWSNDNNNSVENIINKKQKQQETIISKILDCDENIIEIDSDINTSETSFEQYESNISYPCKWLRTDPEIKWARPGLPTKRGKRKIHKNKIIGQAKKQDEIKNDNTKKDEPQFSPDYFDEVSSNDDCEDNDDEVEPPKKTVFDMFEDLPPPIKKDIQIKQKPLFAAKISDNKSSLGKNYTLIEDILFNPGRKTRPPRIIFILRGLPGSGKTYLAKLIKDKEIEMGGSAPRIMSIDDYFTVESETTEICKDTGRKINVKKMDYEYEKEMEETYTQYLLKSYKKTVVDGLFTFIIIDCVNDTLKSFDEFYQFAKVNNFMPYVCDMKRDLQKCLKQNIHKRSETDIKKLFDNWMVTPEDYQQIDTTSLLEVLRITEVEMDVISDEDELPCEKEDENENEPIEFGMFKSKWETGPSTEESLARLDGTSKPPLRHTTIEDYLQMDGWEPPVQTKSGQKRVRWADLEEKRAQDKMRAIGFVVGQTDWNRMNDPTGGSSALTQTKYIERVKKN